MTEGDLSRRRLMRSSAQAAMAGGLATRPARAGGRILGVNDRIAVGVVGTGSRGSHLMK